MISSRDIINWFHGVGLSTPFIYSYPEASLDDPHKYGRCAFILYEAVPNVGHWTILFRNDVDNMIEFFDPMGYFIDDELDFSYYKDKTPMLLDQLINSSDEHFEINDLKFQQPGTSTCGKWCCLRYLYNCLGMSKEEFDLFYLNVDDDDRDKMISDLYEQIKIKAEE